MSARPACLAGYEWGPFVYTVCDLRRGHRGDHRHRHGSTVYVWVDAMPAATPDDVSVCVGAA
jgi:hypothetical protein